MGFHIGNQSTTTQTLGCLPTRLRKSLSMIQNAQTLFNTVRKMSGTSKTLTWFLVIDKNRTLAGRWEKIRWRLCYVMKILIVIQTRRKKVRTRKCRNASQPKHRHSTIKTAPPHHWQNNVAPTKWVQQFLKSCPGVYVCFNTDSLPTNEHQDAFQ